MELLYEYQQRRRVLQITFPTGDVFRFRLLTWGEYQTYQEAAAKQTISSDILEDSLIQTCIFDYELYEEKLRSKAGFISTIASLIMGLSGPSQPEAFTESMGMARQVVNGLQYQVVGLICRAFPAYKPEELDKLSWADLMIRLAQAEQILMARNELAEPLRLLSPEEQEKAAKGLSGKVDPADLVKDGQKLAHPDFLGPNAGQQPSVQTREEHLAQLRELRRRGPK